MDPLRHTCQYFDCDIEEGVHLYHIVDRIYFYLCIGHARVALSSRQSTLCLIEFLIAVKGSSRKYRDQMRKFVIQETARVVDGR